MSAVPTGALESGAPAARNVQIGHLLVEAGHLTHEQVDRVIFTQRKEGLLFGEAAMRLGLIDVQQIQRALLLQYSPFGIPDPDSGLDASLLAALDPFSKQAESIRDLRSQLTLRWFGAGKKILAVVGVNTGDGCSAIAANLAIAFAQLGERTVLMDANLRAPRVHELFGVDHGAGLSAVLASRVSVKDAMTRVPALPGLMLLPAGPRPPNPQELLSGVMFDYILETLPATSDVLIIDTPALLSCADAQLIAAKTGACVMAVRRHKTPVGDIMRAADLLAPAGVTTLGAVLND
ncbi:MAG: polysaccharide biosynthesis tyrosine autokinase [Steroidobacteraceae bacterium]